MTFSIFVGLIGDNSQITWLGLRLDESWKWVDDTETDFINWRPGQPDKNETEFCGRTVLGSADEEAGFMDDDKCDNSYNFACEYFPSELSLGQRLLSISLYKLMILNHIFKTYCSPNAKF